MLGRLSSHSGIMGNWQGPTDIVVSDMGAQISVLWEQRNSHLGLEGAGVVMEVPFYSETERMAGYLP